MGCAELQGGLFSDFPELCFRAAKRSDMSSAILEEGRFANTQESRIQVAKRSDMGNADI